uniref:Zinc finger, CCHC-type n=1 Tax=Tanacetum cinerariifolium TaxID=118510 RepID=A0A6L2JFQ8_TANCI|nr:hypothetical protein [Tanacetum cinerariifolium]
MGDEKPICTLRDYSKPSHEGYRNTIELPVGNNVYLFDPTPSAKRKKKRTYDVAPDDDSKETNGPDMEVSVNEAETKNGAESSAKNE